MLREGGQAHGTRWGTPSGSFTYAFAGSIIVTEKNVSLDHVLPIQRGGAQTPDNIEGICDRCNQIKGNMTKEEFQQLLADFQPVTKASILARLRAGARSIHD
jgi:5-methylcytosine-specific restriction endonuclease McrA